MTFNPIDHPICMSFPLRTTPSAWTQHVPFGMALIELLQPRQLVELGTHQGMSYCAFCQAVKELGIDCRCFAIDNWKGDEHAGLYGPEILADLKAHHDSRYEAFSTLIHSDFDDARDKFADKSIDLLHIDGFHTYDAVKHDVERWLPKMSSRGVIILHDVAERGDDFGVWKLWDELKTRFPHNLEFYHGHGLGLVAVGETIPSGLRDILAIPVAEWPTLRELFRMLGTHIEERLEVEYLRKEVPRIQAEDERQRVESIARVQAEDERQRAESIARVQAEDERQRVELIAHIQAEHTAIVARHEEQVRSARERVDIDRAILLREHEAVLAASRRQIADLDIHVNALSWQLAWFESSRGVRVIKLARASRAVLKHKGPFALTKHTVQWIFGKRGYYLRDIIAVGELSAAPKASLGNEHRAVLFISGCPGDAMRYRCYHQAEQLNLIGGTFDVGTYGEVDLSAALEHFQHFVFHRVPYGPDIEWFINEAHLRDKIVIFDTDDLVFEPSASKYVAALEDMTKPERDLYMNGLARYQKTMLLCDAVIVSTAALQEHARRQHAHVIVAPNAVSQEMVHGADLALSLKKLHQQHSGSPLVTIGYFSGTATHNRDFLEASDAVLWALENYPSVGFKVVGHLRLDSRFERFQSRIEHLPLQRWQDLPNLYTTIDINLAPLEPNNPFTDSKSCIKYLESGLLGIPTIASPRADFVRVIEQGENGFLAETPEQWREALQRLIESADLRQDMGQRAYERVRQESTTRAQALSLSDTLRDIVKTARGREEGRKLAINWIVRAPIAERGGGYRTIFRLANYLGEQGHTVRVYVEPIAHLERMSHAQIRAFVAEHFGPLKVEVMVGHDKILPADASIATNWPTAFTVADHVQSFFKFYFVQDFEPEFYELSDRSYREAERTYSLPLQQISIGPYLGNRIGKIAGKPVEVMDFALDNTIFYQKRTQEERVGPTKVLFFARPGLKRRGYDLGIAALALIKEQRPDAEILLFGSTKDEIGKLPFLAQNLGVLPSENLAEVLNTVHVLLSFSLSNISWVPFEGMACGAAVVEANVPSVREMVDDNDTCILADTDPATVAAAVVRLIDDPSLRAEITTNAVQKMGKRTWENTAEQFEQILLRHCW